MKNGLKFLIVCMGLLAFHSSYAQEPARYNLWYQINESTNGCDDRGNVDLYFYNDRHNIINKGDVFGYRSYIDTFSADATTQLCYSYVQNKSRCMYSPPSITTYYTSDIQNAYKLNSYWQKRYTLPGYAFGTRPDEYIKFTIWPANLKILNEVGKKDADGWVITEDQTITFNATPGFPADAYTWQYKLSNSNTTVNLPSQYQGKSSITFNGIDLLTTSDNFKFVVDNGINVEVGLYGYDSTGSKVIKGKAIVIYPKYNGPKVQSITAQPAKCFEDDRTSVVIKFNQALCNQCKLTIVNNVHPLTGGDELTITSDSLNSQNEYVLKNVYLLQDPQSYDFGISGYYNANGTSKASQYYINTDSVNYKVNTRPLKLSTTLTRKDILCYGGQDGQLAGKVTGGTSPYFLIYKNKNSNTTYPLHVLGNPVVSQWATDGQPINDLLPAEYKLTVTDGHGCKTADSTTLTQPATPLSITELVNTEASGYGLSNGSLQVTLKGGTLWNNTQGYALPTLTNGSTTYSGQFLNSTNGAYVFQFNSLPAGNYTFNGVDGNLTNYGNTIRDNAGCKVSQAVTIIQPPLLVATIEQTQSLHCFGDATASLIAHAIGGRPFQTGLPYSYLWSYSIDGVAAYTTLAGSDSVLSNRIAGFYKVVVQDRNNNTTTKVYEVTQPSKIGFSAAIKNVTCANYTDGKITLSNLNGGTGPYTVLWPDGTTDLVWDQLAKGTYTVQVTDTRGCFTRSDLRVKDTLNGITIEQGSRKLPTCSGGNDGSLGAKITVESMPYNVLWNTGSTDTVISHLQSGEYTIQVFDSKNCLREENFTLSDPLAIPLNLPEEQYLCIGQTAEFNLEVTDSNYVYNWDGPGLQSNGAQVSLSGEGLYKASITNSLGCSVTDSVKIFRVNKSIASEFTVSGQVIAGDEVSLVNITPFSLADTSVWILPAQDVEVINTSWGYANVIFQKAGTYKIGLKSYQGQCEKLYENDILVFDPTFDHVPYTGSSSSFIKAFEVRPVPNDGHFEVYIRLQDIASVKLRFLDYYSKTDLVEIQASDAKEYTLPMDVQVANGNYILFLETAYGTSIVKVVILK